MRTQLFLIFAALAAVSTSSMAQKPGASAVAVEAKTPTGGAVAQAVEIEATVTAIDKEKRTVTVKGPKGRSAELSVSDEVKNLDKVKIGDTIKLKYYEALSLQLDKAPGAKPGITITEEMVRAKGTEKPAGGVQRKVTVVGTVTAVDEAAQLVTVRGPKGNEVDIKVQDPAKFKIVKTGDLVKATYTEALVVSVAAPAKEGKAAEIFATTQNIQKDVASQGGMPQQFHLSCRNQV